MKYSICFRYSTDSMKIESVEYHEIIISCLDMTVLCLEMIVSCFNTKLFINILFSVFHRPNPTTHSRCHSSV